VLLARLNTAWRDALHLVSPETLLRWHRSLFTRVWRRTSRGTVRPRRLRSDVIALIKAMATANRLWGAERIRGELLKLGIRVSKRTVQKYRRSVRPRATPGQTWGTFLRNHTHDIWACDFLQLYDAWFHPIYAFVIVCHGSREVVHANVTRAPTDAWVAQQLREATPYNAGPRFLIRDRDHKFGGQFAAVAAGANLVVVTMPPQSPNLNAICERFLGSLRRECLDHILILGEHHLRQVRAEWVEHFNGGRPHQGIGQRIPNQRRQSGHVDTDGSIVAVPVLRGLHHDYRRAA
jgi:putative transposase